ncbi:MAG: pantoate--beta-alanine ligase [Halofilum sp. (in: g-proteobacteria)]
MIPAVSDPATLRRQVRQWRAAGETTALVPTMGDLHQGHLRLVAAARERAARVVVSIFVNPLQFGPGEDYEQYPRVLERDRARLADEGADLVFAPSVEALYPRGVDATTRLTVPDLEAVLCGAERPGHFSGVATVVAKLFNATEPDIAVFGEKDYQQLLLLRRMAEDLDFAVEIAGVATVREDDGLALSSRNGYLTEEERARAPTLHATLQSVADRLMAGERDFPMLERDAMAQLQEAGMEPSYIAIRRAHDLAIPTTDERPEALRVLGAARLGRARLIDNVPVGVPEP